MGVSTKLLIARRKREAEGREAAAKADRERMEAAEKEVERAERVEAAAEAKAKGDEAE